MISLRSLVFRIVYPLYVKPKTSREDRTKVLGFEIVVPPTVFHPSLYFSSKFFAKYLLGLDLAGKKVLDIGCGSGILSLAGAKRGASVTSVDLNPAAVEATRKNAGRNGFGGQIFSVQSDIFSALQGERYDLIISNPPYLTGEPTDRSDLAWRGGEKNEFFMRLASTLKERLLPGGKLIMVLSSDSDLTGIKRIFSDYGIPLTCLLERRVWFEKLSVWEAKL